MSLTVDKCLQAWTNSLKQMNAKADIVFFGDSLLYYGDFASVFPDKVVCNLGLRGDTITGMLYRIEQVKQMRPSVVYLMAGINDVPFSDPFEFGIQYQNLVKQIHEELPKTRLIIHSLLPVNDTCFTISCNNVQIINCNKEIAKVAKKYSIQLVDLFSAYEQNGELPQNVTIDGLHIHKEAYIKWFNLLITQR